VLTYIGLQRHILQYTKNYDCHTQLSYKQYLVVWVEATNFSIACYTSNYKKSHRINILIRFYHFMWICCSILKYLSSHKLVPETLLLMGNRAVGFVCLYSAHIYTTHFASYIKTLMYFILWEIQYIHSVFLTWYQSHCSNFLMSCSLVFVGIFCCLNFCSQ